MKEVISGVTVSLFDRLATRIAGQNVDFTEAEVEADVATAVAATRDNTPGH